MKSKIVGPEETAVAMQWLDKHISMAIDIHAIEKMLEKMFSMQSVPRP
jgi:hypothetical protein